MALARSLIDRSTTVLADGSGAYWHTGEPERIYSDVLIRVCREKVLGPIEAQRDCERESWRHTIEALQALDRLGPSPEVQL